MLQGGKMQVGDEVAFGMYEWQILDIQKDKALIITKDIIEQRPYHNACKDTTWADCALRKYLNGDFYNKFTVNDRAKIIRVTNYNQNNPWYGSIGGENTQDNIFLLDIEEVVCKYFGDSSANLQNRSAKQKYWFQKKDKNNESRIARFKGGIWWWWLRSPGRSNVRGVYIHGDGNLGIQGNNIGGYNSKGFHYLGDNNGGVRPALWLKL